MPVRSYWSFGSTQPLHLVWFLPSCGQHGRQTPPRLAAVALSFGCVSALPFPCLAPAPRPRTAKATEVWGGAGTLALPLVSCARSTFALRFLPSRGRRDKANAPCLSAATSSFGCIPAALFPRLAPVPRPREAKAAKAWSGAGTHAPMLASCACPCCAVSMPCGIAVVRLALLPLWLLHRCHCTLQWCRDPCCNGAVAP